MSTIVNQSQWYWVSNGGKNTLSVSPKGHFSTEAKIYSKTLFSGSLFLRRDACR
jgi:hypothetical protein